MLRATHVDSVSGPQCPSCARALADGMLCCPYDGTPVGSDRCTGCDKTLDAEWQTCPWCRTPVPPDAVRPVPPRLGLDDVRADEWPTLPRPARPADATHGAQPPALPRLLVVGQDPRVAAFVTSTVAGRCEVVQVTTADDALAVTSEGPLDAALVDEDLSDLPGLELVRLLRAEPGTAAMPLFLSVADLSPELARAAAAAGADECLPAALLADLLATRVLPTLLR